MRNSVADGERRLDVSALKLLELYLMLRGVPNNRIKQAAALVENIFSSTDGKFFDDSAAKRRRARR